MIDVMAAMADIEAISNKPAILPSIIDRVVILRSHPPSSQQNLLFVRFERPAEFDIGFSPVNFTVFWYGKCMHTIYVTEQWQTHLLFQTRKMLISMWYC